MSNKTYIPVSQIHVPEDKLREVELKNDKQKEKFQGLIKSIQVAGVIQPVVVVPYQGQEDFSFTIQDGLHRLEACRTIDPNYEIPYVIDDVGRVDKTRQIIANVNRIDTSKRDLSNAIREMHFEDGLTLAEICANLGMSELQVLKYLSLQKFDETLPSGNNPMMLIDKGLMTLSNGLELVRIWSRLTIGEKEELTQKGIDLISADFSREVQLWKDNQKSSRLSSEERYQKLLDSEYVHEPKFMKSRLEELKEKYQGIKDDIELDGGDFEGCDKAIYDAIQYIYCNSVDDIEAGQEAFEIDKQEKIEAHIAKNEK